MAAFGFDEYTKILSDRVTESISKAQKPPLTIGIYGQWGSGKSKLLEELHKELQNRQKSNDKKIIPVMFNAWRFEKEEHLIIPLLKTLYYEIKKIIDTDKQDSKIKEAVQVGKNILRTLLASIEIEASVGFFKAKLKGDKVIENAERLANEDAYVKKMEKYESLYFDIHAELARFAEKISVVFLIDDLDRCLPENVLKVLESIKLFLDIEGFAFVLAVDDDVVERGIIHRYKEYKDKDDERPIITGAEYLEKIVSLPFKIPKIEHKDSKDFFTGNYPELFVSKVQKEFTGMGHQRAEEEKKQEQDRYDEKLLELFAFAVPPVPRRLIRAAELYKVKKGLCVEKNIKILIENPYHLARFVILELFAPDIFRLAAERHRGKLRVFNTLSEWKKEHESLHETEKIKSFFKGDTSQDYKDTRDKLLAHVSKCNNGRNGFILDSLFVSPDDDTTHRALTAYITMKNPDELHSAMSGKYATIERADDFVTDILSSDREARKGAISGLDGNIPLSVIGTIVAKADSREVVESDEWWEDIYEVTDEAGWTALVNGLKIIERLTDEQQ